MPLTHCMLDLETWGTKPGCAIRSIGAVMFDPFSTGIGTAYYANIDRTSCERFGLKIERSTEEFWYEQAEKNPAAVSALHVDQMQLPKVAAEFCVWWRAVGAETVWAHGINFDAPIWERASNAVTWDVPWHYRATRDTRTIFWLAGFDEKSVTVDGPDHHALFDAVRQAKAVQAALAHMKENMAHSVITQFLRGVDAKLKEGAPT